MDTSGDRRLPHLCVSNDIPATTRAHWKGQICWKTHAPFQKSNDHFGGFKNTRKDTPDIPLRPRTEDDNYGFRRLEMDDSPDARYYSDDKNIRQSEKEEHGARLGIRRQCLTFIPFSTFFLLGTGAKGGMTANYQELDRCRCPR